MQSRIHWLIILMFKSLPMPIQIKTLCFTVVRRNPHIQSIYKSISPTKMEIMNQQKNQTVNQWVMFILTYMMTWIHYTCHICYQTMGILSLKHPTCFHRMDLHIFFLRTVIMDYTCPICYHLMLAKMANLVMILRMHDPR